MLDGGGRRFRKLEISDRNRYCFLARWRCLETPQASCFGEKRGLNGEGSAILRFDAGGVLALG